MAGTLQLVKRINETQNAKGLSALKIELSSLRNFSKRETADDQAVAKIQKALSSGKFRIFLKKNDLDSFAHAAYVVAEYGHLGTSARLYKALEKHDDPQSQQIRNHIEAGEHAYLLQVLDKRPDPDTTAKVKFAINQFSNPERKGFNLNSLSPEQKTELLSKLGVFILDGVDLTASNEVLKLNARINEGNSEVKENIATAIGERLASDISKVEKEPTKENLTFLSSRLREISSNHVNGASFGDMQGKDLSLLLTRAGKIFAQHGESLDAANVVLDINERFNKLDRSEVADNIKKVLSALPEMVHGYSQLECSLAALEVGITDQGLNSFRRIFEGASSGFNIKYLDQEKLNPILIRAGIIASQINPFELLGTVLKTNAKINNENPRVLREICKKGLAPMLAAEINNVLAEPERVVFRHINGFIGANATKAVHFIQLMESGVVKLLARFEENHAVINRGVAALQYLESIAEQKRLGFRTSQITHLVRSIMNFPELRKPV